MRLQGCRGGGGEGGRAHLFEVRRKAVRQETVLLWNAEAHWHKVFACRERWLYVLALRKGSDSKIAKTRSIGHNMRKLRVA